MKKKTAKFKEDEKKFSTGEVMSMLENINDGIGVLADGQKVLEHRMDGLEHRMDGMEHRMDRMQDDITVMKQDVTTMQGDITEIKFDLKRKVSYDEFEKLEKRVLKLEKARTC